MDEVKQKCLELMRDGHETEALRYYRAQRGGSLDEARAEIAEWAAEAGVRADDPGATKDIDAPEVMVTLRHEVRDVACPLTTEEFSDRAHELAVIEEEIGEAEKRHEMVKREQKAEMGRLISRRARVAGVVRERKEIRPKRVRLDADYRAGVVYEIVEDTGVVLRTRPVLDSERQVRLIDGDDGESMPPDEGNHRFNPG